MDLEYFQNNKYIFKQYILLFSELCHGENKLLFNEMMMRSVLY